jgi:hypothetical protein
MEAFIPSREVAQEDLATRSSCSDRKKRSNNKGSQQFRIIKKEEHMHT